LPFCCSNVNVLYGKGDFMNEVRELADTARSRMLDDVIRIINEEMEKNTDEAIKKIFINIKKQILFLAPPTRGATRGFGARFFK